MYEENEETLITLDFPKDDLLTLCLMAHDEDITLNELANRILMDHIDEYDSDFFENSIYPSSVDEVMDDEEIDDLNNQLVLGTFKYSFNSFDDFNCLCDTLYQLQPEEDREYISKITEETFEKYLARVHFNYGQWLRNRLDLWNPDNKIVKWFNKQYRLTHADDISSIIIAGIVFGTQRRVIRNRVIVNLVHEFHEHWRKMNNFLNNE